MLNTLTLDTFVKHVGETFRLRASEAEALDLELVEVTPLTAKLADGTDVSRGRQPFSLVFRGPAQIVAPQRMYAVEHAGLGTYDLFVVPVGPGKGGMLYEVVFT